jgi:hypothetical protein
MTEVLFRRREAPPAIVETGMLREVHQQTLDVHYSPQSHGGIVVYTGASRIGKTTAAEELERKINQAYAANDSNAFRARYMYVGGDKRRATQRPMKRGIKSLYTEVIGPLEDRVYWRFTEEGLAAEVVKTLQRKKIQLLFVDEAGTLSADEIRGMVSVWDMSQRARWPFTLILIGMDDLPTKIRKYEQVRNRISRWCYFEPYDLDAFWEVLAALNPHFAGLDGRKRDHREQVEVLHEECGGLIGKAIPFLTRFSALSQTLPQEELGLDFLRAIILDVRQGELLAERAQKNWSRAANERPVDSTVQEAPHKKARKNGKGGGAAA